MSYSLAERVLKEHSLAHPTHAGAEVLLSCPFTENHKSGDRNPGFRFNTDSGLWVCFGANCGKTGNIYSLYKQLREMGWISAEQRLEFTSNSLQPFESLKEDKNKTWIPNAGERSVFNTCVEYLEAGYESSDVAQEYVEKTRGLSVQAAADLGISIGYCPSGDFLSQLFGPHQQLILQRYGLLYDNGGSKFTGYVTFRPHGAIWLQGRAIRSSVLTRFQNTSTPKPVIGLPIPDGEVVIVESIIDGITVYQYLGLYPIILNGGMDIRTLVHMLAPSIKKGLVYCGLDSDVVKLKWVMNTFDKDLFDRMHKLSYGKTKDPNDAYLADSLGIEYYTEEVANDDGTTDHRGAVDGDRSVGSDDGGHRVDDRRCSAVPLPTEP